MSCPKNPKRWLWFRWEGPHDAHYANIRKSGEYAPGDYAFTEFCELCHQNPWCYVTHCQALRHGIIDIDGNIIGEGMKVNV